MISQIRLQEHHRHCCYQQQQTDRLDTVRLRRSLGEGNGYSFQYSCLENTIDGGARCATVRGVAELDITEPLSAHAGYVLSGQMWLPLEVWGRMNTLRTVPPTFLSSPRYWADQWNLDFHRGRWGIITKYTDATPALVLCAVTLDGMGWSHWISFSVAVTMPSQIIG